MEDCFFEDIDTHCEGVSHINTFLRDPTNPSSISINVAYSIGFCLKWPAF